MARAGVSRWHVARDLAAAAPRVAPVRRLPGRAPRPPGRAARADRRAAEPTTARPSPRRTTASSSELARQVGLALHNVQLDSALQASLDELPPRNDELRVSRARIVAAGDAERRKLERNLHDGAQQHLVALAVKLRLAKDAVDDDPADADRADRRAADRPAGRHPGAAGAGPRHLPAAARQRRPRRGAAGRRQPGRAADHARDATTSAATRPRSRRPCTSAASRRCRTRASTPATARRSRCGCGRTTASCSFEVADDGAGFDSAGAAVQGHGFVNMADRLGAIDGAFEVDTAPGQGTRIRGRVPVPTAAP